MTQTIVGQAHSRIRVLMQAVEQSAEPGPATAALQTEIDHRTKHALGTSPEDARDALLQIDLAVPLLEAARDDSGGATRIAIESGLLALASAAEALGFCTLDRFPGAESVADLAGFCARASTQSL